jgi:hypothetical protein
MRGYIAVWSVAPKPKEVAATSSDGRGAALYLTSVRDGRIRRPFSFGGLSAGEFRGIQPRHGFGHVEGGVEVAWTPILRPLAASRRAHRAEQLENRAGAGARGARAEHAEVT